ncbi:TspO/MBR family protein [Nocardioides mesophilus]|uniref:Tryptophan-rich sensory protein n=1 Tax=Nocardioides mesophilus TaxID=433659 RepID=A0A7G9R6V2_9ACTN|nr:TspO/MBR family protein [Nocardioides mesophilus]QNN51327.1 tryptophan-rich sensory protein [Nocardioides mesophilus]
MSGGRLRRLLGVAGAVAGTAGVGGLASQDVSSQWYADLDKPPFQPPGAAFPVAWTLLYADIVLACAHALDRLDGPEATPGSAAEATAYRRALAANLALNAGWSWVFFRSHRLGPAVGVAGLLTLSGADLVRRTHRVSPAAAVALAPYPAWCAFATVLSAAIWRRNR